MTGDDAAAESLYRAARDIQRSADGPQTLAVAALNARLAEIFTRRGKYQEAEATAREALAIRERLMGPEHASTAAGLISLAELLRYYRNQPVEAESLYHRAIEILRKQPRPRPALLSGALGGLESIAHWRGDHVRAEAFAREVLDAHRRALGAEHPIVAEAMETIAEHLAAQRRYSEAEDMLRASIALLQRTVGSEDFRTAGTLTDLGRVHAAAGRLDEAENDLRRALTTMERLEGPVKEYEGEAAALLADVIERRGRTSEASVLFDRAATILRPLPQRFGYGRVAAYTALADHYRAMKRPVDEQHFRQLAGTLATQ